VLFVIITRAAYGKEKLKWLEDHHEDLMEKAKKVEAQNIDPELEYELSKSRELSKPDQP
jgi:HAE1 family hydrophobic/amphiphilic exporter-1